MDDPRASGLVLIRRRHHPAHADDETRITQATTVCDGLYNSFQRKKEP